MGRSPKYLGLGLSRKGQNLDNVIVGWFTYGESDDGLQLFFGGKDSRDLWGALEKCVELIGQADAFWAFYTGRGQGYYIEDEYFGKYGRPDIKKGQFERYDEERVSDEDEQHTQLAWHVHCLRRVELEWPDSLFATTWPNFKTQLRRCELNDEPGRGPLKRFLAATQRDMQTEWVPAAAMAFQALRRGWAKYGEQQGGLEEDLLSSYTYAAGTPLEQMRAMRSNDEEEGLEGLSELDDPQYVFREDRGELDDLLTHGAPLY